MKKNHIKTLIIALLILMLFNGSIGYLIASQEENIEIFTWVSVALTETQANTLVDLGFTDVALRYNGPEALVLSKTILENYGIDYWQLIIPWCAYPYMTGNETEFQLEGEGYGYRINDPSVADDCHVLLISLTSNEWIEMLDLMRLGEKELILTFYANQETLDLLRTYNFSGVKVDLYCRPNEFNSEYLTEVCEYVDSLGVYLWVWTDYGYTWESITEEEIRLVYQYAQDFKAERFCVWLANETDVSEIGMYNASFLNYPEIWDLLRECNSKLKSGERILTLPTATPTVAPTNTPTPTNTPSPIPNPTPTISPTPSPTITPTPNPTLTPNPTPFPTHTSTPSQTPIETFKPTQQVTITPTESDNRSYAENYLYYLFVVSVLLATASLAIIKLNNKKIIHK